MDIEKVNIISSGSNGNATILFKTVLIDCGVAYKKLKPFIDDLKIVLLTHIHSDHFKKQTIKRLSMDRPLLRFACCEWLLEPLLELGIARDRIDVCEIGKKYDYSDFKISPVKLYHDVPNAGWRVFFEGYKVIYCTDTYTLDGIKARNYDFYLIEGNYEDEEDLKSYATDEFYIERVKHTHLSREYARNWLLENMGLISVYEFMHKHVDRRKKDE